MSHKITLLTGVVALLLISSVSAHHSQSEFDFKQIVDIEGKVSRVDWRSPHARLYVDVLNEKGETVTWDFELPSPTTLMRRGWKRDSLKFGDHVKVNGARARNFPNIGYARTIKTADGKALFTGVTQIYEPESALPKTSTPERVPEQK